MMLRSITEGAVAGATTVPIPAKLLGGVSISADGTNNTTVVCRTNDVNGAIIFHMVTKNPVFVAAPLSNNGSATLYYSISGTGGLAQLYEWVD